VAEEDEDLLVGLGDALSPREVLPGAGKRQREVAQASLGVSHQFGHK